MNCIINAATADTWGAAQWIICSCWCFQTESRYKFVIERGKENHTYKNIKVLTHDCVSER